MKYKTTNTVKTIATIIAFLLVAVLVVGLCLQFFVKDEKYKPSNWFASNSEGVDDGANVDDDNIMPVGEGMLMLTPRTTLSSPVALAAQTDIKTKTATLTASVEPENGYVSSVYWRSSSNALSVIQDEENPLQATVELVGTLTQTAQITCTVRSLRLITATCSVDYLSFPTVDCFELDFGSEWAWDDEPARLSFNSSCSVNAYLNFRYGCGTIPAEAITCKIKNFTFRLEWSAYGALLEKLGVEECGWFDELDLEQNENGEWVLPDPCSVFLWDVDFDGTSYSFSGKDGTEVTFTKDEFYKALGQVAEDFQAGDDCPVEIYCNVAFIYNGVTYKDIGFSEGVYLRLNSFLTGVDNVVIENGDIVFTD